MKKSLISKVIYLLAGFSIAVFIYLNNASSWMMLENESRFNFEKTIIEFEESAKQAGWSVPTSHDLQQSLAKSGKEVGKVQVFALCNPDHAEVILKGDNERIVSSMMPCRVAVYVKANGKTYVSRMNSRLMSKGMHKNVSRAMKAAFNDMEDILSEIIISN
jgi:uncharacterized protein (DUF302 family)